MLHRPEHPERFTEFSREVKEEGGDRGDLGKKKGESKGEREIKPVIIPLSKHAY